MSKYCVKWTRNDSIRLGEIAMQSGLTNSDAENALAIGARMLAHGFTGYDIDQMIQMHYANALRGKL